MRRVSGFGLIYIFIEDIFIVDYYYLVWVGKRVGIKIDIICCGRYLRMGKYVVWGGSLVWNIWLIFSVIDLIVIGSVGG